LAGAVSLTFTLVAIVLTTASPAYAAQSIPEPASIALFGTAAAAVAIRSYRNRTRR
jgi:hypothetical protein